MILYHGTSAAALPDILQHGIQPRRMRMRTPGNWGHSVPSSPKHVYLTSHHGIHFGKAAARGSADVVVLQVSGLQLNPFKLMPDEDFLEQVSRTQVIDKGLARYGSDIHLRTRWFRNRLHQWAGLFNESLQHLGTCAYAGHVPRSAIMRYAAIKYGCPVYWASDATLTVAAHRVMQGYYESLTKYAFGDLTFEEAALQAGTLGHRFEHLPRDGVTVHDLIDKTQAA